MAIEDLNRTISQFENDVALNQQYINGQPGDVPTAGGPIPNLAKQAQQNTAVPRQFDTLPDLQLVDGQIDGQMAKVTEDPVEENNGDWVWRNGTWVQMTDRTGKRIDQLQTEVDGKVNKAIGARAGVLVSIVDRLKRSTWLEANSIDGGLTAWAKFLVYKALGFRFTSIPGYMFALTDSKGRLTDLAIESRTGRFAPFVIERLRQQIGYVPPGPAPILYPQLLGGSSDITAGDFYIRDSEVLPVMADMTKLAGWGSSSMFKSNNAYSALAQSLGMSWYNGGITGQATPQIAARAGSIPALCTFPDNVIPGDTTEIAIATPNVPGHGAQTYFGSINGVAGRIRYSGGARFQRTTAGDPVPVDPLTPFIPDEGAAHRAALTLLWMGRNDLGGNAGDVEQCIKNTDATFDWLAPKITRRLVLGHFKGDLTPDSPVFHQIDQVNDAHRKRYGHLFIDVNAYLLSDQIWIDMGLEPTQADKDARAIGSTPPSLLGDPLHLALITYDAVSIYQVRARVVALGWVNVNP